VSVLSFGSWVTFGPQLDEGLGAECLAAAHDAGVNFYDNAEGYEAGKSERIMGKAIGPQRMGPSQLVVSTKLFWGIHNEPNMKNTLNRKYLMQAIDGSLERFGLDFVDLLFCHRGRPDHTHRGDGMGHVGHHQRREGALLGNIGMDGRRDQGRLGHRERHHLHKPVMEQPQYNILWRGRVEFEYDRLYRDIGLGLTTWSPLASGLLSGKYLDGVPEGAAVRCPATSGCRERSPIPTAMTRSGT